MRNGTPPGNQAVVAPRRRLDPAVTTVAAGTHGPDGAEYGYGALPPTSRVEHNLDRRIVLLGWTSRRGRMIVANSGDDRTYPPDTTASTVSTTTRRPPPEHDAQQHRDAQLQHHRGQDHHGVGTLRPRAPPDTSTTTTTPTTTKTRRLHATAPTNTTRTPETTGTIRGRGGAPGRGIDAEVRELERAPHPQEAAAALGSTSPDRQDVVFLADGIAVVVVPSGVAGLTRRLRGAGRSTTAARCRRVRAATVPIGG